MRTGAIVPAEFRARAAPMLERIEAIDPENASALAIRGEIADELGEHDEAVRLASRAAAAAPGVAWVHVILATIHAKQGDIRGDAAGDRSGRRAESARQQCRALSRLVRCVRRGDLDEARAAVLRAMELDPKNSSNYWELSLNDYARGDLVGAIVNSAKGYVMDPDDSESPAVSAVFLGEIGEIDAAQAWVARIRAARRPATFMRQARRYRSPTIAATCRPRWTARSRLVTRRAEERHDFWHNAMTTGCLAARELGRYAEFRAAMEAADDIPRDFSPAGFAAWVGPKASPKVRLRQLAGIRRCVFDESAGRCAASRATPRADGGERSAATGKRAKSGAALPPSFATIARRSSPASSRRGRRPSPTCRCAPDRRVCSASPTMRASPRTSPGSAAKSSACARHCRRFGEGRSADAPGRGQQGREARPRRQNRPAADPNDATRLGSL